MHSVKNIGLILFYETVGQSKYAERFIIPLIEEAFSPIAANNVYRLSLYE